MAVGTGVLIGSSGCNVKRQVWDEPYYVRQSDKNHSRAIDPDEGASIVNKEFDSDQNGYLDNHETSVAIEKLTNDRDLFDSTRSVIGKALAKKLEEQHKNPAVPGK